MIQQEVKVDTVVQEKIKMAWYSPIVLVNYVVLDSHPSLPAGMKLYVTYNNKFYVTEDGFRIYTKKEIKSDFENGYLEEYVDAKAQLYNLVNKAMPSHIGGFGCVIRDLILIFKTDELTKDIFEEYKDYDKNIE